jgi:hypothetical protein
MLASRLELEEALLLVEDTCRGIVQSWDNFAPAETASLTLWIYGVQDKARLPGILVIVSFSVEINELFGRKSH